MTATAAREHRMAQRAPDAVPDVMIAAIDVTKTYRMGEVRVPALRGVNFGVNRGEMVAITGHTAAAATYAQLMNGVTSRVEMILTYLDRRCCAPVTECRQ